MQEGFVAYCKHFKISFSSDLDAENKYATHFDSEWKNRGCLGYEVVIDLHNNSNIDYFKKNRDNFKAVLYQDTAPSISNLETTLKTYKAFLNVTYLATSSAYHSVTLFNDNQLYLRDTNFKQMQSIQSITGALSQTKDGVLYKSLA